MDADGISRLDNLERRVAALEIMAAVADSAPPSPPIDLRQLNELRHREGPRYVRGSLRGAVAYAGAATLGEGEVLWAGEHGLPQIWDLDLPSVARLLAALGHPARLALVRALLAGVRTSQELQEVINSGSAGQLYHHLKDLIAAGVVDQAGRSRYRISDSRIVPLLVILAAAGDVARPHDPEGESAGQELPEGER
jgi:DNA-binding transcriptional ArsR family regulator